MYLHTFPTLVIYLYTVYKLLIHGPLLGRQALMQDSQVYAE